MRAGVEGACKASKIIWREKLFDCQKIHFFLHPGHRCFNKNERLGRLPYYCINVFSFHFASTASLNCNFFLFSVCHRNLIFTHYFCRRLRTHIFAAVFLAINRWFEEAVVETGDEFSIIYIFINLFVNNAYFRVNYVSNFVFH